MVCHAISYLARPSFLEFSRLEILSLTVGSGDLITRSGRGFRSYLYIRKNGDFPVTECEQWL